MTDILHSVTEKEIVRMLGIIVTYFDLTVYIQYIYIRGVRSVKELFFSNNGKFQHYSNS
jgi:hypothetical protein